MPTFADEVVELRMQKWFDELNDAIEYVQQEVCELQKKETELETSVSLLRSTLESTANGIVAVSFAGHIESFNQKFVDMWQIPDSLMLSRNFLQVSTFFENQLKNPEAFLAVLEKVSVQRDFESCDILELKDGRIFAQYSKPQCLDNEIIGRVWSIWDISAVQKTKNALWLNEAIFCTLAETTDANIFVIRGSHLSYVNPAVEVLTGYTKEELLTGFDIGQLLKNKDSEYQEISILTKDGTERWLACTVAMFDFEGTPVEMIAGIDITDSKQAESEFRQALEQVKQLSEQRANFVSMACHQLRTPLNVVSVSNSLLQKRIDERTTAKMRSLLDHIQTAVEKLSQMLNDILLFAQAEAAKLNFEAKPLDLVRFCNKLVAQMQLSSAQNPINFVSQYNSLSADVDQELLERILKNLLDNAIKYSPTGSAVDLQLTCEHEKVIFQVIDRGIGILAADRQRLFEPFYRGNNVKNLSGTGLGLSIVKNLVDLYGGQITIESEVGIGTTVTVVLPSMKPKLTSIQIF
ncbi:sensor histidine kinase [Atlanticothrix silvestris]|uniref:sensor histidine kinase n=1 Tax=Atlanticothrix silvestris TaxID=2840444 RepID=UPI001CEDD814|nr:ATP-binding protein [Atlanticothrix silvestris]